MKKRCMQGMLIGIALLATAASTFAQRAVATGPQPSSSARTTEEFLARPISIDIRDVSLADAITIAAVQANTLVQYKEETLQAYPKRLTMRFSKVPLGIVLSQMLAGTPLRVGPDGAGQLVVTSRRLGEPAVVQGTIVGKVIHAKTKQPIRGATVILDNANLGVTTDDDGTFRIVAGIGERVVHVRAVGFIRMNQRVMVREEGSTLVEIVLEPSASVLDQVIVTGTVVETERRAITTPITIITADEIEKRGITRIEQLFRGEVPGLFVAEKGAAAYSTYDTDNNNRSNFLGNMESAKIYSRGAADLKGGANPIKTYVDGVELLDPKYLGTIDPQSIERIEILTGPQAATIYGSGALGGVMQIFTKKSGKMETQVTLNLRYGMLENSVSDNLTPAHAHTFNVTGGYGGKISFAGTLSYNYTGQWQPSLFIRSTGGSVGASLVEGPLTLRGSIAMRAGENGTLNSVTPGLGSPVWNSRFRDGTYRTYTYEAMGQLNQRISESFGQTFALSGDYRPYSRWQHGVSVGMNQVTLLLRPLAAAFVQPNDSLYQAARSTGSQVTMAYNTTVRLGRESLVSAVLTAGGNRSQGDGFGVMGCLGSLSAAQYVNCGTLDGQTASITQSVKPISQGGFVTARLGIIDHLFITLGLRGEKNASYGQRHSIDWTPTNGIAYSAAVGDVTVKFLASYGKATRSPTIGMRDQEIVQVSAGWSPQSFVRRIAAPDLTPEYSRGPQAGMEVYVGSTASVTLNHYRQTITDLIQYVAIDSLLFVCECGTYLDKIYQYQNVAKIRQFGWEATGTANLKALLVKWTYSWNDSRVMEVNSGTSSEYRPGASFRNIPTHMGNVNVGFARGSWTATLVTNWVGIRPVSRSNTWWYHDNYPQYLRLPMYTGRWASIQPNVRSGAGYAKSDMVTAFQVNRRLSARFDVINIGNSYASEGNVMDPSLGRQTLLGLVLRFP